MKVMQKRRGDEWGTVDPTRSMDDSHVEKVVKNWKEKFGEDRYRVKEVGRP